MSNTQCETEWNPAVVVLIVFKIVIVNGFFKLDCIRFISAAAFIPKEPNNEA